MLSLSPCLTAANTLNLKFHSTTHHRAPPHIPKPISAIINPSNSRQRNKPQQEVYQPYRPPPSPLPPQYRNLDIPGRIDILANRLGVWHEYAPLISSLLRDGFTPPTIEELTGITGVEQNRYIVAAQVRDSLLQSGTDPNIVDFFDNGGAELLYQIRLLSASQRAAAARFIIENKFDGKGANELARSIKDFPMRRGEKGWETFDYNLPGDCLSFMYYRQSREHFRNPEQRTSVLEQALYVAESENAKATVQKELKGEDEVEEGEIDAAEVGVVVPVVRLKNGEVAAASSVAVLPVCKADENGGAAVLEAPFECRSVGEFGVIVAEKGWERWVVLPRWEPLVDLEKGCVAVSFADARVLPWKANRWYKEEPILVVADRSKREVGADDGFFLVNDGAGLKVERGLALKERGLSESLGTVILVVRPPRDEDDGQLSDEDWD